MSARSLSESGARRLCRDLAGGSGQRLWMSIAGRMAPSRLTGLCLPGNVRRRCDWIARRLVKEHRCRPSLEPAFEVPCGDLVERRLLRSALFVAAGTHSADVRTDFGPRWRRSQDGDPKRTGAWGRRSLLSQGGEVSVCRRASARHQNCQTSRTITVGRSSCTSKRTATGATTPRRTLS